jgi:hypothetical protein
MLANASKVRRHQVDATYRALEPLIRKAKTHTFDRAGSERSKVDKLRQGYGKKEFALPAEVFDDPNPNIRLPDIRSREFFAELSRRVWAVFEPELEKFLGG